jgi:dihydrofolate reductase
LSQRPRVSVFLAQSLDGFIADEAGGVDWLNPYHGIEAGYEDFIKDIDCLIMGRASWETVQRFDPWPYAALRVIVMTHRPLLARLAAEGARHVYLDGGDLVRQGLREGVVDSVTLTTTPDLLGRGRPLFDGAVSPQRWTLRSLRACGGALAQATYDLHLA